MLTSTDRNALHEGLDLVVEGDALRITVTLDLDAEQPPTSPA